mgnify:FL=1
MENNISIERFASMVLDASMKYPKAKVASIGSGRSGDHWYYGLFLKVGDEEIRVEIPAYEGDV